MTDASPASAPASGATTGDTFAGVTDSGVTGPGFGGPVLPGSGARTPPGGSRPRRRRRTPWRAAFFALAAAGIVAAVAWALLGDRLFVVRSETVTGTHLVTPAKVIAAADVPLGTPLMRVDAGAVTRRVEAIRQVASVTVTEDWPDHLAITVTERVPAVAVRLAGGGYDLMDPTGTIVRWARTRPAMLPLLTTSLTGSALLGDPGVAAAADVLAELDPSLARSVASVSVAQVLSGAGESVVTAQQVTLALRDGKTVVWGDPSDAAQKNRELTILLRDPVRYVDVSAPGAVVTR
jgi:cell division protein FtsQ